VKALQQIIKRVAENPVSDRVRTELFRRIGLGDLLTPRDLADTKLGLSTIVVPQFFCALPLPKKRVAKKMAA
jgi:hypothetical protein